LIDINDHSADEANQEAEKAKRRRSSKKMKLGKNGMYPMEDVLIRRWWASHDDDTESGGPGTSREEVAKNRIAQLRVRETQLQMRIILEVLPVALPAMPRDWNEKVAKSKKLENLPMLIDVHIDRLCIWQSIALEAIKTPVDGEPSTSTDLPIHTDSVLRDFCVEVIVPL
jgi:DNA replication regulator SLD3